MTTVKCPSCKEQVQPRLWHYSPIGGMRYQKTQHLCNLCGTCMYETGGGLAPIGVIFMIVCAIVFLNIFRMVFDWGNPSMVMLLLAITIGSVLFVWQWLAKTFKLPDVQSVAAKIFAQLQGSSSDKVDGKKSADDAARVNSSSAQEVENFIATKLGAEQGDADNQTELGCLYEKGLGTPKDCALALEWYRKAAEQGSFHAQFNLGIMYEYGRGVLQEYTQALHWYRKSAEQGYDAAQSNLGYMYVNGQGVPQNFVFAYMLYNLAAANGYKTAVDNRDIISLKMTRQQIQQGQELASKWKIGQSLAMS